MTWAAKTYTFSPATVAKSSEVNQNFDDMVDQLDTAMPSGGIILWSGAVAAIPSGWYLCNGANGTPDLRDRFVVGAGSTYAVGDSGGATTHTHTYSGTTSTYTADVPTGGSSGTNKGGTHSHTYSGTTSSSSNLPPYYALAYIMKS
jgi:hypothetical protein